MWQLTVRLSSPRVAFFQEIRQLLDRHDTDSYLSESRAALYLASPDQPTIQLVAAWTLRNTSVLGLHVDFVRDDTPAGSN